MSTLTEGRNLLEHAKFLKDEDNEIAVRTIDGSGILKGLQYDFIDGQQPNTTTDIFVYKQGGSGGNTVATLTVVYTDVTKNNIDTVTRT